LWQQETTIGGRLAAEQLLSLVGKTSMMITETCMNRFVDGTELSDFAADAIVGISHWARETRNQIREISKSLLGVLISGPNGTGKELIARAIHALSGRADKPFIPVDCASAIDEIFASHLFGQLQGSFTGARTSLGCFRAAHGGTLFLDEIGELTLQMQTRLLRVLEEKSLVPVGAVHAIPIDVRVIAATNRDLREDVRAGRFRRDLYHRVNMIELKTIPLKDRPQDIGLLARHFVAASCLENGVSETIVGAAADRMLRDYDWPGNVRELKNVMERVLLVNDSAILTPKSLALLLSLATNHSEPQSTAGLMPGDTAFDNGRSRQQVVDDAASARERRPKFGDAWLRLDDLERYHIQQTLEHALHNQTTAAALLGITRRVLARLMKKHGLDNRRSRHGDPKPDAAAVRSRHAPRDESRGEKPLTSRGA
jgi:DNA-binding NtrC family response regulator